MLKPSTKLLPFLAIFSSPLFVQKPLAELDIYICGEARYD